MGRGTGGRRRIRRQRVKRNGAGTARDGDRIVTAGGRVLAVSALGDGYGDARSRAYEAAATIEFEGKHVRNDIAERAEMAEVGG